MSPRITPAPSLSRFGFPLNIALPLMCGLLAGFVSESETTADEGKDANRSELAWSEGDRSPAAGATRDFFNGAALLRWDHFMGDWRDGADQPQGDSHYASVEVADTDSVRQVSLDVTGLVREWTNGTYPNQGIFLRAVSGGGDIRLASREHTSKKLRPTLVVTAGAKTSTLSPVADTFLTKSTYRSQGLSDTLRVSSAPDHALIRFDLSKWDRSPIDKAILLVSSTAQYGSSTIGVFRCSQGHPAEAVEPRAGLAAGYPRDVGIADNPQVLFAASFETPGWHQQWTEAGVMKVIDTIDSDPSRRFAPVEGRALRVRIAKGANGALNTLWRYAKESNPEPTEAFFRYYLRLGDDWNQTLQGGKLPGFSGTYGRTGWGGRRSYGKLGWSARGLFRQTIPAGNNPLAGKTPIGTYCYHADMEDRYGTNWIWQIGNRGYLEKNRWYSIEQQLKLNTPGQRDGVLRAWVDGRLAFEKTDIRFRHEDQLKIEQVWMNIYHGGTKPSPYDQHVYVDQVVIATEYIGPMSVNEED